MLTPRHGPRSIESVYDELLSAAPTLELTLGALEGQDGVVLACYSDHPVIAALREVTRVPVVGIAEASMHVACLVGRTFGIVTTSAAWEPLLWDAVRHYGLEGRCAAVRATGRPVLALEAGHGEAEAAEADAILVAARRVVEEDGAEVICLGCAGMAGLDKRLEAALGVPVLDGVVCAVKLLEGLLADDVAVAHEALVAFLRRLGAAVGAGGGGRAGL